MKKAILLIVGIILIWGALALYFMGSIPFAEMAHCSVRVFDILAVVIGFAGFICICYRNDIKRKEA